MNKKYFIHFTWIVTLIMLIFTGLCLVDGVSIFVINDVADKIKDGRIQATPMTYRFDYGNSSVNSVIPLKGEKGNV